MGVAAYVFLFLSIVGCIAYGLINWSKESTVPSVVIEEKDKEKTAG
ncbi:MAG: hypothetical protein JEZ04_03020 [Spirochaetales bacterium]|nr:hypothetical protein [Spirochaetales bacterium]